MSDLYQLGRRLAEIALADMGADELDLAPGEFLVLQDLTLNGRSSVSDITKRTGLAQSRVSTGVRALTTRGWTRTEADPNDGRRTLVDLTPEIRAAAAARRAARADDNLRTTLTDAGANPSELPTLTAGLTRLHQLLVRDQSPRRFPNPTG
ncbi:MarR family winged helix-turn-helix transcriptional regulator [Streptacidiphilus sp. EB129]|uniref:MarR family winged helix-turn-helix transcriptional regulator n=1 Tax=Streptacidiphilus sp. EB129 TaxID=3156262 RepID=UPI003515DC31